MLRRNFILKTDSYKLTHHDMLPVGTTGVYSYLEARKGGEHPATLWFGLQYYLQEYLAGVVVTHEDIVEAKAFHAWHLHGPKFNESGWQRIVDVHGGRLPIRILAAPEGMLIPCGNVLMTIENTDPELPWLTNVVETLLMKVWYPTTVATRSYYVKKDITEALLATGCDTPAADYMLHDFGYRGASSEESAGLGGMAHLVNFKGSDTIEGIRYAREFYAAPAGVAVSVAASEHSIMTALGADGELTMALRLIAMHQNQILSLVADSYDYYRFVDKMIDAKEIVDRFKVKLVLRPDSVTDRHKTPTDVVLWTLGRMKERMKCTETATGDTIVPYGVLWGDGLEPAEIEDVLNYAKKARFAASNLVFGMGGGLLQKVNRDTDRFALKCSAQCQDGKWVDIAKKPLQASKASKAGRLKLVRDFEEGFRTVQEAYPSAEKNILQVVFENGVVRRQDLFTAIQQRAAAALREEPLPMTSATL